MNTYTISSGSLIEFVLAHNKKEAIGLFLIKTGKNESEITNVARRKRCVRRR
jgi:hypothetical protein